MFLWRAIKKTDRQQLLNAQKYVRFDGRVWSGPGGVRRAFSAVVEVVERPALARSTHQLRALVVTSVKKKTDSETQTELFTEVRRGSVCMYKSLGPNTTALSAALGFSWWLKWSGGNVWNISAPRKWHYSHMNVLLDVRLWRHATKAVMVLSRAFQQTPTLLEFWAVALPTL